MKIKEDCSYLHHHHYDDLALAAGDGERAFLFLGFLGVEVVAFAAAAPRSFLGADSPPARLGGRVGG